MTRSSSSELSALSNINVANIPTDDTLSERVAASTPPTSLTDGDASVPSSSTKAAKHLIDITEEEETVGRRSKRARTGPSTYNLKQIFDAQEGTGSSSRNVSGLTGKTLVEDDEDDEAFLGKKTLQSLETDAAELPARQSSSKLQRQPSLKDRFKDKASKLSSVLGKRRREVVQAGRRKLGMAEGEASPKANKIMKELDMGTKGVLDELDLSDDEFEAPPPPSKRAKTTSASAVELAKPTAAPFKISNGKKTKVELKAGLYVGQDPDMDPTVKGGRKKLQKKQRPGSSGSGQLEEAEGLSSKSAILPLPMWSYLDTTRDFKLPYDVYAPGLKKGAEKPRDWTKLNKNRLVGDAKELWEKAEKLPSSMCVCPTPSEGELGCQDDCLNRVMQYECNDDNCKLDADACSNRAFAQLAARTKKGGLHDCGVEVVKTDKRGFGVRAARSFGEGQIIMEYTGEIITEGECQRRMREEYKDKQCYYLMELERGLIIDGTKGSMARFINHSCSPNCEVRMVKVNGTPRMAVFAGENGVMTGEELTYDYNFDNFGATKQNCYCGAENCRGTLSKRLNAAEQKKQAREEHERKRKAAEEAQKEAANEARRKKAKTDRGSSWRGWVAVDDPETKERLKAEKKEREEAEKSSIRAERLKKRQSGITKVENVAKKQSGSRRRRSTQTQKTDGDDTAEAAEDLGVGTTQDGDVELRDAADTPNDIESNEPAGTTIVDTTSKTTTHTRTVSTGSKFHEDLPRPTSAHTHKSTSTVVKHTEVSMSTNEIPENEDFADDALEQAAAAAKLATKNGLSRTASKGKTVMKSVGEAIRKSFKVEKSATGGAKLKQSTLSFAKVGN